MKLSKIALILLFTITCVSCSTIEKKPDKISVSEQMKQCLVNLRISVEEYENFQPWKQKDITEKIGYGCAVGPYLILTTADNAANASIIQARRYDKNEFIKASIKAVDYECNLCLLELDPNTAGKPFEPIAFVEDYQPENELSVYWLSTGSHVTNARGILDRVQCEANTTSYNKALYFILTNPSRGTSPAQVVFNDHKAIGIVGWAGGSELGVIPAETVNRFLKYAQLTDYKGFGAVGFEVHALLDPAVRDYLKMPSEIQHGVYVSKVYSLGTGSTELKPQDVILSIDGKPINPYGRYLHDKYDRLAYDHLIISRIPGEKIPFEIFRDGTQVNIDVEVRNFAVNDMLVPFYEYDKQPDYMVYGGYVFQKLTRDYFKLWGDNWSGKVLPHLYQYYSEFAFNPTDDREDIVILSYVLPAPLNIGYQDQGRLVVSTWNGMKIRKFKDIRIARTLNPDSPFDVVEFELDSPKIVIPRQMAKMFDPQIAKLYRITKTENIK